MFGILPIIMKMHFILKLFSFLFASTLLLASCKKSNNDISQEKFKVRLSGFAEKTLFVVETNVRVMELDAMLKATGRQHTTTIGADGRYDTELELQSSLVKIIATGNYYDELTGQKSERPISLEAIVQVGNGEQEANINVFTHLEQERLIKKLQEQQKSIAAAKKEAADELMALLNVVRTNSKQTHEMKFMDGDRESAAMLAISTMLLNRDRSTVNDFLDEMKKDFSDGDLKDELKERLFKDADKIDLEKVKQNLIEVYQQYGHQFNPGDITIPNPLIKTEEDPLIMVKATMEALMEATKQLFVVDALYTRNIDETIIKNNFDYRALYEHTHQSNSIAINNLFKLHYNVVNRSSSVIEMFEKKTTTAVDKYHGTVLLNRSIAYLNIIQYWGDPIMVTTTTSPQDLPIRTPWPTALNMVIADLKKAEQLLPENGENYVASKYAAKAVLARAYLLQQNYPEAKYHLDQIISSKKFKIDPDYGNVFNPSSEETIYVIPKDLDVTGNPNAFFEINMRKGELIPLIRYAEILLMAGECNAVMEDAVGIEEYLNPVFKRQHGEDLDSGYGKAGAEEVIFGLWMSDMVREGLSFGVYKRLEIGEYLFEKPHFRLLPIPEHERQLNKKLTQNPEY